MSLFKYFIFFLCLSCSIQGFSQANTEEAAPMPAQGISRFPQLEEKDLSSEKKAASSWEAILQKDKTNQVAWFHYIENTYYSLLPARSRDLNSSGMQKMNAILNELKQIDDDSHAYHYLNYLMKGKSVEGLQSLDLAYQKRPEVRLLDDMLAKAIIERNEGAKKDFSKKLNASGIYNSAILEYNQNVLNSVEQNATLITYGSADTYPLIILQEEFGLRRDVKIICVEWLLNKNYADKIISGLSKVGSESELVKKICDDKKANVYLGLTLAPACYKDIESKLYCTGLAFKFSEQPILSSASVISNWNNLFKLKYIKSNEDINRNYLLPLIILEKNASNAQQKKEYSDLIELLKAQVSNPKKINQYRD
ncbi:MAG: hypothetical protein ACK4WD_02895 [Flavobacteriales bacterium]|jgi:hypothetical protein